MTHGRMSANMTGPSAIGLAFGAGLILTALDLARVADERAALAAQEASQGPLEAQAPLSRMEAKRAGSEAQARVPSRCGKAKHRRK